MVLITGATGMVGSCLALHLLEKDVKIVAIYRNISSIKKTESYFSIFSKSELLKKIIWEECDILDIATLNNLFSKYKFEMVYHCAALISFEPKDFEKMIKINVEGTANMVNFSLEYKINSFCYVSSIAALGDVENNNSIITESNEWNKEVNHNDYAISKYGAELEVWRAFQEGLPAVIVNPGVILGAGFWDTGSGELFDRINKNKNFYTKGITGFVFVDDLIKIMIQLVERKKSGEKYIIISENISYQTLNEWITGKKPKYHIKPWITNVLYPLDWLISNLFFKKRNITKSIHNSLHSISMYSNEKIVSLLNYKFESIENSIQKILVLKNKK